MARGFHAVMRLAIQPQHLSGAQHAQITDHAVLGFLIVIGVHTINRQRRRLAHLIKPAAHAIAGDNGDRFHDHIAIKLNPQRLPVIHL